MARKIRFPLHMNDGADVRTIEELQEHFDIESVLGYFTDGKLKTWLEDRYYSEQAEAVGELSADMPDLSAKLCAVFGIESDTADVDIEEIQRRKEKLKILSAYTADAEILDNIDLVAMNQDDLFDILDMSPSKVYLYEGEFSVPIGRKNICYIGLKDAAVKLQKGKTSSDYEALNIQFENVAVNSKPISEKKAKSASKPTDDSAFRIVIDEDDNDEDSFNHGEKLFLAGKYKEAYPIIEKSAKDGEAKAIYLMARYLSEGYNVVKVDLAKKKEWLGKLLNFKEPLSTLEYVDYYCGFLSKSSMDYTK